MRCDIVCLLLVGATDAFVAQPQPRFTGPKSVSVRMAEAEDQGFFGKLFQGMDDFIDDATSRRLGNGAAFYGKRKSDFYGKEDKFRKSDPRSANNDEDYRGPNGAGYFLLSKEKDEFGRPIGFETRAQKRARERKAAEEEKNKRNAVNSFFKNNKA